MKAMLLVAVAISLGLAAAQIRTAGQGSLPERRQPVARLTLRVLATPVDGASAESANSEVDLAVGESGRMALAATSDLCASTIGSSTPRLRDARYVWRFEFTLISASTDRVMVDVTMDRIDGLSSPSARQARRRLTLAEGTPHVLDFVERADAPDGNCRTVNLVVEISAAMAEATALASQILDYDLWLVDHVPGGRDSTRHQTFAGFQGQQLPFRFELHWSLAALLPSRQLVGDLVETVSGAVRGRARQDGQIDMALNTSRVLAVDEGSTGDGGLKFFRMREGERVSLELPAPHGRRSASDATGGRAFVTDEELLAHHVTSVILSVNRRR
jgi:hypothetical protein